MTEHPYRHIHICGPPRSGTTLLVEMMRSSYEWDWAPAEEIFLRELVKPHEGRCLTKRPSGGVFARTLLSHPSIWLIYCIRDPRDVICSVHGMAPDRYWSGFDVWRRLRKPFNKLKSNPKLIAIRYEDLVSDPDKVQQALETQIHWLEPVATFSQYHTRVDPSEQHMLALGTLRAPDTASIGRWRQHLPRVAGQLALHGSIQKELVEEGYEQDEDWLEALEGITPDMSPSFIADKRSVWLTFRQWCRFQAIRLVLQLSILRWRMLKR
ncbi:MAG: sulfotransferase family protein [Alphaproteobacteria bacterium]